jgi:hypothetical protein
MSTNNIEEVNEETSLGAIIIGSHPIDTWADFVEYTSSAKRKTSDEDVEQRCMEMKALLSLDGNVNTQGKCWKKKKHMFQFINVHILNNHFSSS